MIHGKQKRWNFLFISTLLIVVVLLQFFSLLFRAPHNVFLVHASVTILVFLFVVWHSAIKKGLRNTAIFSLLALGVGFVAEALGVRYGTLFGGVYYYSNFLGPKILNVPILVILMWEAIIYIAYMVSEHILNYHWLRKHAWWHKIELSAASGLVAALATVAWDLVLDPLAVLNGWWVWVDGGAYFPSIAGGVPLGNFMGWMLVSFVVVFVFKLFFEREYREQETVYDFAPTLAYVLLYMSLLGLSVQAGQPVFAFLGFIAMFPFVSVIIVRFLTLRHQLLHHFKD